MPNLPPAHLIHAEHYQLECYALDGIGIIPVVDGWVQFSLAAAYIPSATEQETCLAELAQLAQRGKTQGHVQQWHILRKPPGLKVRWQLSTSASLGWLATEMLALRWAWLAGLDADSVFGQRELLQGHYPDNYARLLDWASTLLASAPRAGGSEALPTWVQLVCQLTLLFIPDHWLAWEALGRFAQMRSQTLGTQAPTPHSPYDPTLLLEYLQTHAGQLQQGKITQTGTLMLLNYLFNIWGLDAVTQAWIIAAARQCLRPDIAGKEIP